MNDTSKLSAAAQELVKAAIDTTNNTSLGLSKEAVAELKHLNSSASKQLGALPAETAKIMVQISGLGNKLDALVTKLDTLQAGQAALKAQGRLQALQWALTNRALAEFGFYKGPRGFGEGQASSVMLDILRHAMQGLGTYLNNDYMMTKPQSAYGYGADQVEKEADELRRQFRDALSASLQQLTGIKPTFSKSEADARMLVKLA